MPCPRACQVATTLKTGPSLGGAWQGGRANGQPAGQYLGFRVSRSVDHRVNMNASRRILGTDCRFSSWAAHAIVERPLPNAKKRPILP